MKPAVVNKKQGKQPKSKAYLKYKKLLDAIEKQQQFNQNFKNGLDKAFQKVNEVLAPLQKQKNLLVCDYLFRLDALTEEINLAKYYREWFEAYMVNELALSISFFGHNNKKLSQLYHKYNKETDELSEEDHILAQSISDMLGFEVDPKEIYELGEDAFFEKYRQLISDSIKSKKNTDAEGEAPNKKSSNNKAKADKENDGLLRDARAVYLRLIKKFHPDHELDAVIRDQKTEIVKQVTKAYQEENFFELLKLQITYMEDSETEAERLADDMLKRYNKILQQQLTKLDKWLREAHFAGGELVDFIDKNGNFSAPKFAESRKALEKDIEILKFSLADSKKRPKTWFKEQLKMIKDQVQYSMIEDMLGNMFDY